MLGKKLSSAPHVAQAPYDMPACGVREPEDLIDVGWAKSTLLRVHAEVIGHLILAGASDSQDGGTECCAEVHQPAVVQMAMLHPTPELDRPGSMALEGRVHWRIRADLGCLAQNETQKLGL